MALKKLSGAAGRRLREQRLKIEASEPILAARLLQPGRTGRPATRNAGRLARLARDLAWIGRPDMSDVELAEHLLRSPKFRDAYCEIGVRTLRRDIAVIQQRIWGERKRRGARK